MPAKAPHLRRMLIAAEATFRDAERLWRDDWRGMPRDQRLTYLENEVDDADRYLAELQRAALSGELEAGLRPRVESLSELRTRIRPLIETMAAELSEDGARRGAA